MIISNFQNLNLQKYVVDDVMRFDISNNLSQETTDTSDDVIDYENLCIICLNSIMNNNICLPCKHIYHIHCIVKWFNLQLTNNKTTSCPYCKQKCDFDKLIKTIISTNIINVKNIIYQLDFLIKNCNKSLLHEYNIIILKRNYIKLKSSLIKLHTNGATELKSCQYIYISKITLPINILQLISTIKTNKKEDNISEIPNYKYNVKQYILKHLRSPINYIIKYIKN